MSISPEHPSGRRSGARPTASPDERELALFRDELDDVIDTLPASPKERTRIAAELAQMLRDEAEAAAVDCSQRDDVRAWIGDQRERLERLSRDLAEDLDGARNAGAIWRAEQHAAHDMPERLTEGSALSRMLGGLYADIRVALRSMRRRPGTTSVVLATLILGIGLNSAVFSVLNSVLLKPMAVTDSSSLVKLFTHVPNGFLPEEPMAFPDVIDLRESPSIEDAAVQAMTFAALARDDGPAQIVVAEMASDNTFEMLGVRPRLGRLFSSKAGPGDTALRGNEGDVAVISHAAWERRFSGETDVLGKVIRLNGHPFEIIGVAPAAFRGLARGLDPEFWVPIETGLRVGLSPSTNSGTTTADSLFDDRSRRSFWVVARLAGDATVESARADLDRVAATLEQEYPKTNQNREIRVLPYDQVKVVPSIDSSLNTATWVLLGVVFLVLLIAATNLANVLLARAIGRRGEMATRLSMGASRLRIVRQLLVESLVLGVCGAAGGLLLAMAASEAISRLRIQLMVPIQFNVDLDGRVVFFTIAIALFTSILFGIAPAIDASRTNLLETMKESSRGGGRKLRLQSALVTVQVAFSVVLLIFAGLATRSIINAATIDTGFDPDGVAGLVLSPRSQGYDRDEGQVFYQRLTEELQSNPAISQVSLASHVPLNLTINTSDMVPASRSGEDPENWPEIDMADVDETYFDVMGIPLLRGRTFDLADRERKTRSLIVNKTLAEQFWPEGDALGQRVFNTSPDSEPWEIVGVVGNGKYRTLGEEPRPFAYFPLNTSPSMAAIIVKFSRSDQASATPLVQAVRRLDPDMAVTGEGTMQEMTSISLIVPKAAVSLFGALGLIGLLLSAIGLFGVLAYSVTQRTHEIGLRVAIGASTGDVLGLVARRGLALSLLGIAVGSAIAFATSRFLSAMLYGISATDGLSFFAGAAVLLVVAVVASVAPARAALRVSPTEALRYE